MDEGFIFKGGKHSGKTYSFVSQIDPSYITWCEKNAPGMLKERKQKKERPAPPKIVNPPEVSSGTKSAIQPNLNFVFERGGIHSSIIYENPQVPDDSNNSMD